MLGGGRQQLMFFTDRVAEGLFNPSTADEIADASLAVASEWPRIFYFSSIRSASAISVLFSSTLRPMARDLRPAEYGDERDSKMRNLFEKISPLNNAGQNRQTDVHRRRP
jgi:hypothetical protein